MGRPAQNLRLNIEEFLHNLFFLGGQASFESQDTPRFLPLPRTNPLRGGGAQGINFLLVLCVLYVCFPSDCRVLLGFQLRKMLHFVPYFPCSQTFRHFFVIFQILNRNYCKLHLKNCQLMKVRPLKEAFFTNPGGALCDGLLPTADTSRGMRW